MRHCRGGKIKLHPVRMSTTIVARSREDVWLLSGTAWSTITYPTARTQATIPIPQAASGTPRKPAKPDGGSLAEAGGVMISGVSPRYHWRSPK
jgi:hypothetical protein